MTFKAIIAEVRRIYETTISEIKIAIDQCSSIKMEKTREFLPTARLTVNLMLPDEAILPIGTPVETESAHDPGYYMCTDKDGRVFETEVANLEVLDTFSVTAAAAISDQELEVRLTNLRGVETEENLRPPVKDRPRVEFVDPSHVAQENSELPPSRPGSRPRTRESSLNDDVPFMNLDDASIVTDSDGDITPINSPKLRRRQSIYPGTFSGPGNFESSKRRPLEPIGPLRAQMDRQSSKIIEVTALAKDLKVDIHSQKLKIDELQSSIVIGFSKTLNIVKVQKVDTHACLAKFERLVAAQKDTIVNRLGKIEVTLEQFLKMAKTPITQEDPLPEFSNSLSLIGHPGVVRPIPVRPSIVRPAATGGTPLQPHESTTIRSLAPRLHPRRSAMSGVPMTTTSENNNSEFVKTRRWKQNHAILTSPGKIPRFNGHEAPLAMFLCGTIFNFAEQFDVAEAEYVAKWIHLAFDHTHHQRIMRIIKNIFIVEPDITLFNLLMGLTHELDYNAINYNEGNTARRIDRNENIEDFCHRLKIQLLAAKYPESEVTRKITGYLLKNESDPGIQTELRREFGSQSENASFDWLVEKARKVDKLTHTAPPGGASSGNGNEPEIYRVCMMSSGIPPTNYASKNQNRNPWPITTSGPPRPPTEFGSQDRRNFNQYNNYRQDSGYNSPNNNFKSTSQNAPNQNRGYNNQFSNFRNQNSNFYGQKNNFNQNRAPQNNFFRNYNGPPAGATTVVCKECGDMHRERQNTPESYYYAHCRNCAFKIFCDDNRYPFIQYCADSGRPIYWDTKENKWRFYSLNFLQSKPQGYVNIGRVNRGPYSRPAWLTKPPGATKIPVTTDYVGSMHPNNPKGPNNANFVPQFRPSHKPDGSTFNDPKPPADLIKNDYSPKQSSQNSEYNEVWQHSDVQPTNDSPKNTAFRRQQSWNGRDERPNTPNQVHDHFSSLNVRDEPSQHFQSSNRGPTLVDAKEGPTARQRSKSISAEFYESSEGFGMPPNSLQNFNSDMEFPHISAIRSKEELYEGLIRKAAVIPPHPDTDPNPRSRVTADVCVRTDEGSNCYRALIDSGANCDTISINVLEELNYDKIGPLNGKCVGFDGKTSPIVGKIYNFKIEVGTISYVADFVVVPRLAEYPVTLGTPFFIHVGVMHSLVNDLGRICGRNVIKRQERD